MKTEQTNRRKLSLRLQAAADLVTVRTVAADVGTDHGYLPVQLCTEGIVKRAIAMDLREGPLQRAREHIRTAGLADRIETRLSDGLAALEPGEVDGAVITGMGGILITRILRQSPEVVRELSELVLGPQSDILLVRRALEEMHFVIDRETMVKEDGKFYVLIHAVPEKGPDGESPDGNSRAALPEIEAMYGPCLLRDRDPVLREYLQKQMAAKEAILRSLEQTSRAAGTDFGENAEKRRHEIEEEKRLTEAALNRYEL